MPVYRTGFTSVAALPGQPFFSFHTGAGRRAFIRQISYFCQSPLAAYIGIAYPSNTPVANISTTPIPDDLEDASPTCSADVGWGTPPTLPVSPNYLEQITLGPAVGAGVIEPLARDEMITLAKSTYLVWWNFGGQAAPPLSIGIIYEE